MTLESARKIFEKKCNDYGTSWRILRTISIVDQVFIKATRIETVLKNGVQKVNGTGDDIASEFLGIINYGLIGLIQNKHNEMKPGDASMTTNEAKSNYVHEFILFKDYFESQNPHYVEGIENLAITDISDMLVVKITRMKSFHKNYEERAKDCKSIEKLTHEFKVLIFGAFLDIILWSSIGHTKIDKAVQ